MKKRISKDITKTISLRIPIDEYRTLSREAKELDISLSEYVWTKMNTIAPVHLRQLVLLYNAFTGVDYASLRGDLDLYDANQGIYDAFAKLMEDLFGEEDWYDPNDKGLLEKIANSISDEDYRAVIGDVKI